MKLGHQLGLLLDTSISHFRKHGWLLMGLALLWAVSKWTITYITTHINNLPLVANIAALLAITALMLVIISCQAGLLLQASALIDKHWLGFRQALYFGFTKALKVLVASVLAFFTLCGVLFSLSYVLALVASGPISTFLASLIIVMVAVYAILRLCYLIPAIVIGEHTILGALKTTLKLTATSRQLTFTFAGLSIGTILITALISVPWFTLWGLGWLTMGKELIEAVAIPSSENFLVPAFFTICNILIEAWSVPLLFLIMVGMYHSLEDDLP